MMNKLKTLLLQQKLTITTAESCTGGLLAHTLTSQPGSSAYFNRGFITYSNQAKNEILSVPEKTLNDYGAVSSQTVIAMVKGLKKNSNADIAVAISGIAGPSGGSVEKPVGTVCFAFALPAHTSSHCQFFQGTRKQIVQQSVDFVIDYLIKALSSS